MTRRRRPSAQTCSVLEGFLAEPEEWLHGYELVQRTGIASGTLYPILLRLSDRSYLESKWEAPEVVGRPRRHLYRLTADGRRYAARARTAPTQTVGRGAPRAVGGGA